MSSEIRISSNTNNNGLATPASSSPQAQSKTGSTAENSNTPHTAETQNLESAFAAIVYNSERDNQGGYRGASKNERYINQEWLNNCENIQLAA
jgi:hypothetical protein